MNRTEQNRKTARRLISTISNGESGLSGPKTCPGTQKNTGSLKGADNRWVDAGQGHCGHGQCVPIELNKAADLMANQVMDKGGDIQMGPETLYQVSEGTCNLLVNVDGGSRETFSATGWVVGGCHLTGGIWQYNPLVARGTRLDRCTSSVAELIALDEAVKFLSECLTKHRTA